MNQILPRKSASNLNDLGWKLVFLSACCLSILRDIKMIYHSVALLQGNEWMHFRLRVTESVAILLRSQRQLVTRSSKCICIIWQSQFCFSLHSFGFLSSIYSLFSLLIDQQCLANQLPAKSCKQFSPLRNHSSVQHTYRPPFTGLPDPPTDTISAQNLKVDHITANV